MVFNCRNPPSHGQGGVVGFWPETFGTSLELTNTVCTRITDSQEGRIRRYSPFLVAPNAEQIRDSYTVKAGLRASGRKMGVWEARATTAAPSVPGDCTTVAHSHSEMEFQTF